MFYLFISPSSLLAPSSSPPPSLSLLRLLPQVCEVGPVSLQLRRGGAALGGRRLRMARWVRAGWGRGNDGPGTRERGQRGGARGRRGFGPWRGHESHWTRGEDAPGPPGLCGAQPAGSTLLRARPSSAASGRPDPAASSAPQARWLARPHPSARLPLRLSPLPVLTPGGCSDARSHLLATEDASLHFF